jgi:hypothetical protein
MTEYETMVARSFILLSSETPFGTIPSINGRLLSIHVKPFRKIQSGRDTREIFRRLPNYIHDFCGVKPEILSFILDNQGGIEKLFLRFEVAEDFFRDVDTDATNIDRLSFNCAVCQIGAEFFLDYGVHTGMLDSSRAEEIKRAVRVKLMETIRRQISLASDLTISEIFIQQIREGLVTGQFRVDNHGELPNDDDRRVLMGYKKGDSYFLLPLAATTFVNQRRRDNGPNYQISVKNLSIALARDGIVVIKNDENRQRLRMVAGGPAVEYWEIPVSKILNIEGAYLQETDETRLNSLRDHILALLIKYPQLEPALTIVNETRSKISNSNVKGE